MDSTGPVGRTVLPFDETLRFIALQGHLLGHDLTVRPCQNAQSPAEEVETVVMGNVVQAGTKMNPARQAAIHAGLPVTTPALTVNRVCGSGAQAIVSAAQEITLGNINVAVAGGMENMDQAPYLVARGRWGYRLGDGTLYDSVLRDGLNDAFSDAHSGWHTEDLVEKYQLTREAQDRWALRSQQRFAAAQADGHFKSQIVPVELPVKHPLIFCKISRLR